MESKIKPGDIFTNYQGCRAIVLSYKDNKDILIEFLDDYVYRRSVQSVTLRSGGFKNLLYPSVLGVGCIGIGKYPSREDGKLTRAYNTWMNMLKRCYDQNVKKRLPTYKDCKVCDSWLNFQNFAKWFDNNKYKMDGYEIDKDLIKKGNKLYSPNTCALIPKNLNLLLLTPITKTLPAGVSKNGKNFRARYNNISGDNIHIGTFKTAEEAHQTYVVAKEAHVKEVANEWRGRIDERVYNALMEWTVN